MAQRRARTPGADMSRYERLAGFCFLPFYLFLLSPILQFLLPLVGVRLTAQSLNLWYYFLCFAIVLLIFHRFLVDSVRATRLWPWVQAVILGFALYYALNFAVNLLLLRLAPNLANPNEAAVDSLAAAGSYPLTVCIVLLGPIVEEVLMRGLIFGTLRRHSRAAAYIVSVLVFSALHLWQFARSVSIPTLLLSALQYVPGGVALAWTYEKSGTIWGNITLHCLINAIAMGILALS